MSISGEKKKHKHTVRYPWGTENDPQVKKEPRCQWCTGKMYIISQTPDSTILIQGRHLIVNMGPSKAEHIVSINVCPNCGRVFERDYPY